MIEHSVAGKRISAGHLCAEIHHRFRVEPVIRLSLPERWPWFGRCLRRLVLQLETASPFLEIAYVNHFFTDHRLGIPKGLCGLRWPVAFVLVFFLFSFTHVLAQNGAYAPSHSYFIDCTDGNPGDGTLAHPWNSLLLAQPHIFVAGDRIALKRGTVCRGSFSPQGSGTADQPIRLTAYGQGPRPRIASTSKDRQTLLLFNQEHWQIDSLDLSGSNTYGIFVSGDQGTLHHIHLKNLFVHDVQGGALKNKDNGLVVVGPSSAHAVFNDVLVDGVVAAHTSQWAGILVGGGPYDFPPEFPLNSHITVRNSSVQDVYGDGIVLFRDSDGLIENNVTWETGMQPTQNVGTPNAIWTWTCTDCTVRDNEAFLTDSPGVDGGAYDIDWGNTRNTVERNYAHDTQGYCIAVFAAIHVTSESVVRDNLCIDNDLSPRLAAQQGAITLFTWEGGAIRGLRIEHNTILWNPPVAAAPAIVNDATIDGAPAAFTGNRIESSSPFFYRSNAQFAPSRNNYVYKGAGDAKFTLGDRHEVSLAALQAAGIEQGTTLKQGSATTRTEIALRLEATIDFTLDADGLLAPDPRAQLMVLRSLAAQYGPAALAMTVHLHTAAKPSAEELADRANALVDLDATSIRFDRNGQQSGLIRLLTSDGRLLEQWHGYQNAATLGGAVRALLGAPHFAAMPAASPFEGKQ